MAPAVNFKYALTLADIACEPDAVAVPDLEGWAVPIHSKYRHSALRELRLWWGCRHYGLSRWSEWRWKDISPAPPLFSLPPKPERVEPSNRQGGVLLLG